MRSRRGRELSISQEFQTRMAGRDQLGRYKARSALYDLDDLIAAFTHDRVPVELVEARNAIRNADTIEELQVHLRSPYKIVRDAANDEMRLKQGLPPNSDMGSYTYRWGQITTIRVASQQMGPEGTTDSRSERFNLEDHQLARASGNLAGTVHWDYKRYRHHLQAGQRYDQVVTRASIERAERSPYMPIPVDDDD